MKPRILLLEDEETLRQGLTMNLELENYSVHPVTTGPEAIQAFKEEAFDLCILDVMVPEIDGMGVCENIRNQDENIPVLFLSALGHPDHRIKGLKTGADDYVTKPFNLQELLLKVEKLIQKSDKLKGDLEHHTSTLSFGPNAINFNNYEATGIEGSFSLTKKEAALMKLFADNPDEVISRERILHAVWGYSVYPNTRTIDNFVLVLRKKFEPDLKNPQFFKSVRGVGYRFSPQ